MGIQVFIEVEGLENFPVHTFMYRGESFPDERYARLTSLVNRDWIAPIGTISGTHIWWDANYWGSTRKELLAFLDAHGIKYLEA